LKQKTTRSPKPSDFDSEFDKHQKIYKQYGGKETFEKFYTMKQNELKENEINSFGITEYNKDSGKTKLPFEKVFEARYGSRAAFYNGGID